MATPTLRLGPLPALQISPGTLVTVLLLAVLMYPALSRGGAGTGTVLVLAIGIGLFMILSVLVHEIAHAVIARAFGASVDHIALTLWGGHTQYTARRMSATGSVLVSLAGPAANGGLAALASAAAPLVAEGSSLSTFLTMSAWLNIALALFNLLPGLPMDGGRALESVLGAVLRNPELGTRITAWIGRGIAAAVVLYPLWRIVQDGGAGGFSLLTLVWAMLIAGILWQGAGRALEGAAVQTRVRALDAAALATPMRVLPPGTALGALWDGGALNGDGPRGPDTAADGLAGTQDGALGQVLLLDRGAARPGTVGRGFRIDPAAARTVPPQHRASTPAQAVAAPLGDVVALPARLRGDALIDAMLSRPAPVYLVLEDGGALRGVIMSADVNTLLRGG